MPIDEYAPTKLPFGLPGAKADEADVPASAGASEPTAAHLLQPAAEVGSPLSPVAAARSPVGRSATAGATDSCDFAHAACRIARRAALTGRSDPLDSTRLD
jgi:hypothetical protein